MLLLVLRYRNRSEKAITQKVTGLDMKLINPVFLLNEDCSSQYFYSGIEPNTNRDKSCSIAKVDAIDDQNRNSS